METEKNNLADLLLIEVHRGWSRESGTLAAQGGADVVLGTVLGKITATDKYSPLAPAASDGSQTAAAVLIEDELAVAADRTAPLLRRGAVVNAAALVWPAGITAPQKTAALAQLEAIGIVARAVL